jgi:hypothetical protein
MATTKREIDEIVTDIVKDWLEERTNQMKAILESKGISKERGALLTQEIRVPEIKITSTEYTAQLLLTDYYEFVDEGVAGIGPPPGKFVSWYRPQPNTGRFRFNTPYISTEMVDSIKDWGARKGLSHLNKDNMEYMAIQTARRIKRRGLRQTMFFTDSTRDVYTEQLNTRIQNALGKSFEVSIINA